MSTNAKRQARYRQRQEAAGRRPWTQWVTDQERAALEVELTRLRDGAGLAAFMAHELGVERADLERR